MLKPLSKPTPRPMCDPDSSDDLGSLVREQMPGMKVLNVAPAAPARQERDMARPDASRSRPSPQAAANARRDKDAKIRDQNAAGEDRLPNAQPATYFVSVEPEGLEDEDPAIRAAARRHVPVVGRRVVALPDSLKAAEAEDETGASDFRFPDPAEFRHRE